MVEIPLFEDIEIEKGGNLTNIEDSLQDRIVMIRRQIAKEAGFVLPEVKIRPNEDLSPNGYVIKIKGIEICKGEVKMDRYLALDKGEAKHEIEGEDVKEPVFGYKAKWIKPDKKEEVEKAGYLVVSSVEVVATHLKEIIKRYPHEFLGREEVKRLIDNIREEYKVVIDELIPNLLTIGEIRKVLINLLKEDVSIRNLPTILETLADNAYKSKEIDLLTECCRSALAREICRKYQVDNTIQVLTLDPRLEETIASSIESNGITLPPDVMQKLMKSLLEEIDRVEKMGHQPIILCPGRIRRHLKRLTERIVPDLVVLSYDEIVPEIEVKSVGMIRIE
ncbi:MAG: flagellar biosynthesis protein FlhA [bacterium]|nr:flagellar biosynthesis protein FlhA [bacterium]